jgi:hypothetical protein
MSDDAIKVPGIKMSGLTMRRPFPESIIATKAEFMGLSSFDLFQTE